MSNPNGKKGSAFERQTADYWRDNWSPFIDRRVKTGAKDKGDLANVRVRGKDLAETPGLIVPAMTSHRVVVECKNVMRKDPTTGKPVQGYNLAQWIREAQEEAVNDEALVGIVVAKRRGTDKPEDQFVIMTQGDLMKLLKVVTSP